MPNKQCPYRSQEHECKLPHVKEDFEFGIATCNICIQGQHVDAIELVASAIMERVMK